MPIHYQIDYEKKLVTARGEGIFRRDDIYGYQTVVWSRPDVAGFHELIDMTAVTQIAIEAQPAARMRTLAFVSAQSDGPASSSKLAIVAPGDLAFGLARMYESIRGMEKRGTKQVAVFRTMGDAMAYLDTPADLPAPDRSEAS